MDSTLHGVANLPSLIRRGWGEVRIAETDLTSPLLGKEGNHFDGCGIAVRNAGLFVLKGI